MLAKGGDEEQLAALRAFSYERRAVVLHTDDALMPQRRADWSPLNIVNADGADAATVPPRRQRVSSRANAATHGSCPPPWRALSLSSAAAGPQVHPIHCPPHPPPPPPPHPHPLPFSPSRRQVTVWMNEIDAGLREELSTPVFQTWNPAALRPAPSTVRAEYTFERPVVTFDSAAAMVSLAQTQGRGSVWFVGAYSLYSMPLLENGVKSAIGVARRLGVNCDDVEFDEAAATAASASRARAARRGAALVFVAGAAAVAMRLARAR